jgi:hypothetical protein
MLLYKIHAKKNNSIMTAILYSQWQGLVSHVILADTLKNKIKCVLRGPVTLSIRSREVIR